MTQPRRMRSKSVTFGLTLLASTAFTACGSEDDYQAVCVNPVTQQRVADGSCRGSGHDGYDGTGGGGAYWFYVPRGTSAPAVGQRYNAAKGVYRAPSGKTFSKGSVPSKGGVVKSGGFGSSFGKSSS